MHGPRCFHARGEIRTTVPFVAGKQSAILTDLSLQNQHLYMRVRVGTHQRLNTISGPLESTGVDWVLANGCEWTDGRWRMNGVQFTGPLGGYLTFSSLVYPVVLSWNVFNLRPRQDKPWYHADTRRNRTKHKPSLKHLLRPLNWSEEKTFTWIHPFCF